MHHILAKHTGQKAKKIAEDFERDRWMDAIVAQEYGLVDEVMGKPIYHQEPSTKETD